MPQTRYSQPARRFGGFNGLSQQPPADEPFDFPEIFQPFRGRIPTIGKTFPSDFPSSIPRKNPTIPSQPTASSIVPQSFTTTQSSDLLAPSDSTTYQIVEIELPNQPDPIDDIIGATGQQGYGHYTAIGI
jgi:hypothetical protein